MEGVPEVSYEAVDVGEVQHLQNSLSGRQAQTNPDAANVKQL